jgi:para-aminobenzoate synthetase/4-amino-4-deoxychorismate lyase
VNRNEKTAEKFIHSVLSFLGEQENFVFLDTNRLDSNNYSSYIFSDIQGRLVLKLGGQKEEFFRKAEKYLDEGLYLAGWMGYELGHLLEPSLNSLQEKDGETVVADFGVFSPPIIYDHNTQRFSEELPRKQQSRWGEKAPIKSRPAYTIENLHPNQGHEDYLDKIRQIKNYIEAGDTYQVNYTLKLLFDFQGEPAALYENLRNNQSVSYGAYLKLGDEIIQSFSPELFFRKEGSLCTVRPMKGTGTRGKTLADDELQAAWLRQDIKNRSENVMIVDLLRNDLGRICAMGKVETVSLFDIETYQTLHQMTSTIKGSLTLNVGLAELFNALFPCGSVTGAPKIHTMEIIKELEIAPRGVYTGAIGFISPRRDMVFNVPIRTVALRNGKGEMGIGSGIVHDSDPEEEWQESLLKGRFLTEIKPDFQLIETILWSPDGGFFLLNSHMERLAQSAAYFSFPANRQLILEELEKQAALWLRSPRSIEPSVKQGVGQTAQRVRVLLNRDGRFAISATPCNKPAETRLPYRQVGVEVSKVALAKERTDSASPYLFHKTTNRGPYEQELRRARENGCIDVFFMNEKGEVTEGAISNIIIQTGENYYTPPVSCGLLPGTFRGRLLQDYPQYIQEKVLQERDLQEADHIFMANSVRGLVKVELEGADL